MFEEQLIEEAFLWDMANLTKRMTGLPINIYISTKDSVKDKHGPRIRVMCNHSNHFNLSSLTPVGIGQQIPVDFLSKLTSDDFAEVAKFIQANQSLLMLFWNKQIDIVEFVQQLTKIEKN